MKLGEILKSAPGLRAPKAALQSEIQALCDDSRKAGPGMAFLALPSASGLHPRRSAYEREAAAKGAVVLRAQGSPARQREAWARLCAAFHGNPHEHLSMVGITGTNGKTTTSYLCRSILRRAGKKTALLGTVVYDVVARRQPASNTTPGSLELARLIAEAQRAGAEACVMEVSSHALDQRRADGVAFDTAVFTNLTQDHLDYHRGMASYAKAKARLFRLLKPSGIAVVNADDPAAIAMAKSRPRSARLLRFSAEGKPAELRAGDVKFTATETRFTLYWDGKGHSLRLPLPGRFNVANALAAAGAALGLGLSVEMALGGLENPELPPGRFELIRAGQNFQVVVDYAHTPDALERLLRAIREITPGRILTVFGCGGDRDKGKRPKMGELAWRLSDLVLVTSDNPRGEDPEAILDAILAGIPQRRGEIKTVLRQPDRAKAIARALRLARPGDTVVVAGKGHEDYQILREGRIHFSDQETVRATLAAIQRARKG